jgi:hypothetical protein
MSADMNQWRRLSTWASRAFFKLSHNGVALLGLAVLFVGLALVARPDLRQAAEAQLSQWLQERQVNAAGIEADPDAIERATAAHVHALPKEQKQVAQWLSRKYRVAPEPLAALVAEAYAVGARVKLDPTLILAIMAIESGFNPFAQSPVGAQGLMQVMTRVHTEKYEDFGGQLAAFDPLANLRVGVKVLQECIARAGSLEGGLKFYVGAANLESDGGYTAKVLAEHQRLLRVAQGLPTAANHPVEPRTVDGSAETEAAANGPGGGGEGLGGLGDLGGPAAHERPLPAYTTPAPIPAPAPATGTVAWLQNRS